jgi:hypothetical protein
MMWMSPFLKIKHNWITLVYFSLWTDLPQKHRAGLCNIDETALKKSGTLDINVQHTKVHNFQRICNMYACIQSGLETLDRTG